MFPGLKIAHKGVILVCVPLLFELLFVGILVFLLVRADFAIKREALSKQIIYTASIIDKRAAEIAVAAALYKLSTNRMMRDRCEFCISEALREFDDLEKLVDNPLQKERLSAVREPVNQAINATRRLLRRIDRDPTVKSVFDKHIDSVRNERQIFNDFNVRMTNFVDGERRASRAIREQEHALRQAVEYVLIGGVLINIFIAVQLAIYFSESITRRIGRVIDNTKLMMSNSALNEPIEGTDEIAELDSVFYQTVGDLRKAEEMKKYLISMVSHDLRSPLTAVQGTLTLLGAGALGNLPDKARERIEMTQHDMGRLIKLTDDLLDAEKLASGNLSLKKQWLCARLLVDDAVDAMNSVAEQHELTLQASGDDDILVEADAARIAQVLCNFLSNAIKYSPKGETIKAEVALEADRSVVFRVTDKGPGIEESAQGAIFEKYVQADSSSRSRLGKGLGLAICKSLVELHGGSLGVNSTIGQGSTFWFSLPGGAMESACEPETPSGAADEVPKVHS